MMPILDDTTMPFGGLVQLIIESAGAVILAVLIVVLFFEMKRADKRAEQKETEEKVREASLNKQFETLLGMQQDIANRQVNLPVRSHTKEEEETNRYVNKSIQKQLDVLRTSTGANRVGFYLFHNGEYTINGLSFSKMSLMAESLDQMSVSVMLDYQSTPRNLLPGLINQVYDDGSYYVSDIESIKDADINTYNVYKQRGTRAFYVEGVRDNVKDVYLGFISVEFSLTDPPKGEDVEDAIELELKKSVKYLSGILQANCDDPTAIKQKIDAHDKKEAQEEGNDGK